MEFNKERSSLLIWIFIPLIFVWFSTGYLVSITKKPDWAGGSSTNTQSTQINNNVVADAPKENFEWHGEGLVTLWFDDAWESQFTYAYPKLEKEGLKGALAVPTAMIDLEAYMSWNQVQLLAHKGWEITSHTRKHSCTASELTDEYIKQELSGALSDLNSHGLKATNYVSPCGLNADVEQKYAKTYYLTLRTSTEGFNDLPVNTPYNLKVQAVERNTPIEQIESWINTAQENRQWLILMFHQIDDAPENKFGTSYDTFLKVIDTVKASGVKVVLPTQAMSVVQTPATNLENTPNPETPTEVTGKIQITNSPKGYANVRATPNSEADNIIGRVYEGETYEFFDEKSSWYQIEIPDPNDSKNKLRGWVSYLYIKKL